MAYLIHISILVGISAIFAVSLNLVTGQMGLLSLAHAAFAAVGAYTSALITVSNRGSFLEGLLLGMALSALLSLVASLPSLRLSDDYFAVSTFSFQMVAYAVLTNWVELTRGPLGIPGIPTPVLFGWTVDTKAEFAVLTAVMLGIAWLVARRISGSPLGRLLRAIREDELLAQSLGKYTGRAKVSVFAVSAALAAAGGSLYAHYVSFIDPSGFNVMESIMILSMVIVGGADSLAGPVAGAAMLVAVPEILRFVGLPTVLAANVRQVMFGGLLVVATITRPRGLFGRYGFGR